MMKATLTDQTEKYVKEAYASDKDLVEKWHITSGDGLLKCVARTVSDLKETSSLSFFVVTDMDADDEFVGYFGIEYDGTYMPTIFIHPTFRDRKDEFWKLVEAVMEPVFRAGIYAKNLRCLKFYLKKGREIARGQTPHGEVVLFQFERSA